MFTFAIVSLVIVLTAYCLDCHSEQLQHAASSCMSHNSEAVGHSHEWIA